MQNIFRTFIVLIMMPAFLASQHLDSSPQGNGYEQYFGHDTKIIIEGSRAFFQREERTILSELSDRNKSEYLGIRVRIDATYKDRYVTFISSFGAIPQWNSLTHREIGIGYRFTLGTEDETIHPYFRYMSTAYLKHSFYQTLDSGGRLLSLTGIEMSIERLQWKVGNIFVLDIGVSLMPGGFLELKSENTTRRLAVSPYVTTIGAVGIEIHQYATILFSYTRLSPLHRSNSNILSFWNRFITLRSMI